MHRIGALFAALFVVIGLPVFAQGSGKSATPATPPAGTKVQASGADCRRLFTEHRPAADVAYKPGVDVNGKPVVGADLNPSPIKVPDTVTFDIAVDLTKYGLPSNSPLFQPNVKLGQVQMDLLSGKVLYNGQVLGNPEIEALREACRQQGLAPR